MAQYWSYAFRRSTLVDEADLLMVAASMPAKTTIKARLCRISYCDMKAAAEKLGNDFTFSCHGDIFDISRHAKPPF